MKLSIFIPVYNEVKTIASVAEKILNVEIGMEKELIFVDDCSTDGTREALRALREGRFGVEVEITVKIARRGWKIYEVPVSYYGRGYTEGKKIIRRDGVHALWRIPKYRFVRTPI